MSEKAAIQYVERSSLLPLLEDPNVSDISYDGEALHYLHAFKGRARSEISMSSREARDFLIQVANLAEKPFSYSDPILDVSFGRYRMNAVHPSLGRKRGEHVPTFSLRIASGKSKIEGDPRFFPEGAEEILSSWLLSGESIVIAGISSSGKTELQKYLLSRLGANRKCVVIDNVDELGLLEGSEAEISSWITSPRAGYRELVRNALRHDPDYIILAEARGGEMLDALVSAMSGHPIILSVHGSSLPEIPERMLRLAMQGAERVLEEEVRSSIAQNFRNYVLLGRDIGPDGSVRRYLKALGRMDGEGRMETLLERGPLC